MKAIRNLATAATLVRICMAGRPSAQRIRTRHPREGRFVRDARATSAHATRFTFCHLAFAVGLTLCCTAGWAQKTDDIGRPAAVIPLSDEAPPRLVVYPPLVEPLARGVVILQYRTENIRIIPVFGNGALGVSPRVGHLHVTVDDRPGTWAHTSEDPIIVVGLQPGLHKMRIEVADPVHKILVTEIIAVTVPGQAGSGPHRH